MKIGLVLDDTLDTPDGVQQYVLNVGAWLGEHGHEVHYLVGESKRTDIARLHSLSRNISVRFNANRMSIPLPGSKEKLRAFLKKQKFDVLHVQVPYSPFLAGRLLKLAPETTAVVGTFHILPYSSLARGANRVLAQLNRRSGRRFDKMLAVSEPAQMYANLTYHFREIGIVPNPVKLAQFAVATATTDTTNIVFLGRLVPRKGAAELLQAVAYLRDQKLSEQPFQVYIGGKGAQLLKLKAYAATHGLNDIVNFAGFIAEVDKAQFLAEADLAVFPSTSGESFGIVLLEAMAVARGVVLAGNNPGYASVIPDPGQLVEPTDTPAFAARLAEWLNDPAARTRTAAKQKEYVRQFDINQVGKQLVAVYTEALQSRRKS